jgi:lipopolysaccharide O-acetyltransferase
MSVVTGHIPEYSIAVGSPAKVIKKFNFETQMWERV